jgi:hypothetical protein
VLTLSSSDTEEDLEFLSLSLVHGVSSQHSGGGVMLRSFCRALVVICSGIGPKSMIWPQAFMLR